MSNILSVLFKRIPGILFESVAVAAALGLIIAAVMCWKRRTLLYWLLAFSCLFMLGWRMGIQIISQRYASALIFPAVIASAYFCFQTESLVKYIPKFPEKWCRFVPYVFILILGISSIVKVFHFNHYGDYVIRASELIRNDLQKLGGGEPFLLSTDSAADRLSYYTGFTGGIIVYNNLPDEEYVKNIGIQLCRGTAEPAEHIYLVLHGSTKRDMGFYLQNVPADLKKQLHYLGEFYLNRRKRGAIRVYRYDVRKVFEHSVKPYQKALPSAGKPTHTISFEKTLPSGHPFFKNTADSFAGKQFLQAPELKTFPAGWHVIGTPGYERGTNAVFDIVKGADGRNLFHIKAAGLVSTLSSYEYPAGNWRLTMRISGRKNTVYSSSLHCYTGKHVWNAYMQLPVKKIGEDDKVYEYTCVIPAGAYPLNTKFIRPAISLTRGELYVHSIELRAQ